ncbi:hypothetical protein ACIQUQ_24900 [Streptomyces sp. NPDC101118]|uniref:hypothetical protein n=1 Tax=Streptomyces sp. NPDC101118 TaxID=3366109 RepID=UPI003822F198
MTESYAGTHYPHLREVLDPRYAGLTDGELEEAFAEAFGEGLTLAEYEEFFGGFGRTLEKAAKQVGRVASAVGPGVLQGAMTGSALGPFGALGGAVLGGTGAALQRYGGRQARGVGGLLGGGLNAAGALTGRGPLVSGLGGLASGLLGQGGGRGGPATSALMGLLGRPELARALTALSFGRPASIPVGSRGVPVPAGAFAGLLGALAREAEAEWAESLGEDGAAGYEEAGHDEDLGRLLALLVEAEDTAGADPASGCGCGSHSAPAPGARSESRPYGGTGEYEEFDEGPGFGDPGEYAEYDEHAGYDEHDEYDEYAYDQDGADLGELMADSEEFADRFHDLVHAR